MGYPLLSFKEYLNKNFDKPPYIYEKSKPSKHFICLGSNHSNDPKHPQFKLFKKKFIEFAPEVLFVEGNHERVDWVKECKTEKNAMKSGEMAYLSFLAQKRNIQVLSWEPGDKKELALLERKYSKRDIFTFYMLRMVGQNIRFGKPKKDILKTIERFKRLSKWNKFDFSIDQIKRNHQRIFGRKISYSKKNAEQYSLAPYPIKNDSILNKIAAVLSRLRDEHAVKTIFTSLKKHGKVMAIMGWSHVVIQEPAYNKYFG